MWEATGNGAWSWASGQCWKSWCRDVTHAKVTEPGKGRPDGAAWDAEGPEQGLRSHHQIEEETRNGDRIATSNSKHYGEEVQMSLKTGPEDVGLL